MYIFWKNPYLFSLIYSLVSRFEKCIIFWENTAKIDVLINKFLAGLYLATPIMAS